MEPWRQKNKGRVMCNYSVIEFFIESIDCNEFKDKSVIEVGSQTLMEP